MTQPLQRILAAPLWPTEHKSVWTLGDRQSSIRDQDARPNEAPRSFWGCQKMDELSLKTFEMNRGGQSNMWRSLEKTRCVGVQEVKCSFRAGLSFQKLFWKASLTSYIVTDLTLLNLYCRNLRVWRILLNVQSRRFKRAVIIVLNSMI